LVVRLSNHVAFGRGVWNWAPLSGKSWSAFNAIIFAMRHTPHVAALYVAHGSEDLFFNDVHYTMGAKHFDGYIMEQVHFCAVMMVWSVREREKGTEREKEEGNNRLMATSWSRYIFGDSGLKWERKRERK
jgi:hypothetical protein